MMITEALDDADHELHHVKAMRDTAFVAAVDAAGGDTTGVRTAIDAAIHEHITTRI